VNDIKFSEMAKIRMVVLDMAGTTVNENNLVYKTLQKTINNNGFNVSLEDVLRHGAGKEKCQAIADVLNATSDIPEVAKAADKIFQIFKMALEEAYNEAEILTYPGMNELFSWFRKNEIRIVLNTGYDSRTANKLLLRLGWQQGKDYDALITADDVAKGRPHPDMIFKAMELFRITDAAEVLKAGDSAIDILEGKNAKCGLTVGVLSGAQNREQLESAEPDFILNDVTELKNILD
jgi:phosphonatase-like hydrolase